jgi:GTPase SAR1 family protein
MFSLASGIYQSYWATPQLNILVLGCEGVGKTTLLERCKVTQFSPKPIQRTLSCPAPPRYSRQRVLIEEDSASDRGKPSQRWLDDRQESSLEDVEWTAEPQSQETTPGTNDAEEEDQLQYEQDTQQEYNLKPGCKMLPLSKIRPTMGQNLAKIDVCGAKCHLFDISGQFQDLWQRYYNDADGVVYVWRLGWNEEQQAQVLERVRNEIDDNVPLLIFGHVMGETSRLPTETEYFLPHYHSNLLSVQCGSAKTGKGVKEAMEWLIPLAKRQAKQRITVADEIVK